MSLTALKDVSESSIIPFIALKTKLESLPLRNLIEEFTDLTLFDKSQACNQRIGMCLIRTGHKIRTYSHQELCWAVLERKIRSTFTSKGYEGNGESTPRLNQILSISFSSAGVKEHPVPTFVLRTMMQLCRTAEDMKLLVERHPSVVHVEESEGNFLLHKVSMLGYAEAKSVFEFVLFEGLKQNVHGDKGFGGLVTKNSHKRSPLVMMYGYTVRGLFSESSWRWLATLIQKLVYMSIINDKDYESISSGQNINMDDNLTSKVPLLHAALEIGCPPGIINRILKEDASSLFQPDMRGKTPLQIACSNRSGHATTENVTILTRSNPDILLERDLNGNWPIHLFLKSQIKSKNIYQDDISLVATLINRAPESLEIRDPQLDMYPFLLAAIEDRWSTCVIYGLLRSIPHVLSGLNR